MSDFDRAASWTDRHDHKVSSSTVEMWPTGPNLREHKILGTRESTEYRRCDLWRHSKTITWFARIPPGKTFVFWQPATFRKWMQCYRDYSSFCSVKHDVYSVLSTEGGLNVNIGNIVLTHRSKGKKQIVLFIPVAEMNPYNIIAIDLLSLCLCLSSSTSGPIYQVGCWFIFRFFDTTPVGRILVRFSFDTAVIDRVCIYPFKFWVKQKKHYKSRTWTRYTCVTVWVWMACVWNLEQRYWQNREMANIGLDSLVGRVLTC